ncbi:hypothetical protein [Bryobacter aggregatus]|uniref:hypothetical protein n=1 Tax=Bryobacter aggregatus TaxID=360054 RepID=UPI0004E26E99|nr:hypothetical protein [Bryobacter aggregatus]
MKTLCSLALGAGLVLSGQEPNISVQAIPAMPAQASFTYFANRAELAVKGAPYSADTITEMVQTLGDGNRISQTNKSSFARDSEGRTRRETTIVGLGKLGQTESPIVSIFIDDPVTKTSYTLDPNRKVAFKSKSEAGMAAVRALSGNIRSIAPAPPANAETLVIARDTASTSSAVMQVLPDNVAKRQAEVAYIQKLDTVPAVRSNAKHEDLGTQNIEGVSAKGSRVTMIIPAGEMGNERAIEVVTETWYSNEIKATVLMKHSDPRMGETTTRISNLHLGEPSKSLFEPPSDYQVDETPFHGVTMPAQTIRVREEN